MSMDMMGSELIKSKDRWINELQEVISNLREENEKLMIENGLLRESSEDQRKLNVQLRIELQRIEEKHD